MFRNLKEKELGTNILGHDESASPWYGLDAFGKINSNQGGESRGLNDRVHEISCRYSDKTCKKINYTSTNTYSIIHYSRQPFI